METESLREELRPRWKTLRSGVKAEIREDNAPSPFQQTPALRVCAQLCVPSGACADPPGGEKGSLCPGTDPSAERSSSVPLKPFFRKTNKPSNLWF